MNTRILYNSPAEQSVLGGLILDNQAWDNIADRLHEKDFYSYDHQIIFRVIALLANKNQPFDLVTITEELKKINELNNIGGEIYLVEILRNTPTSANIVHYANIVKEYSQDRKLLDAAQKIIGMIHEKSENRCDEAEKIILKIREDQSSDPNHVSHKLNSVYQNINERSENPGKLLGLSTGFQDLDKLTKGLKHSNLIILAARPSMGKTQLALNIAEHVAIHQQKTVLIFSMEMPEEELDERLICSLSKIDNEKIQSGNLTKEEQLKITETLPIFNSSKLYLDDSPGLTMSVLRAKCRRIKNKHGLSLVVVDYLSLMDGEGETETKKIGSISRGLKRLAKELKVPVLALSQLNRNVESRDNKRPLMSDLRQSGEIEQDADIVMFIYRHEFYHNDTPAKNVAEIIISKNRAGATGKAYLTFRGNLCRFDNYYGIKPPAYEESAAENSAKQKGFKVSAKYSKADYSDDN